MLVGVALEERLEPLQGPLPQGAQEGGQGLQVSAPVEKRLADGRALFVHDLVVGNDEEAAGAERILQRLGALVVGCGEESEPAVSELLLELGVIAVTVASQTLLELARGHRLQGVEVEGEELFAIESCRRLDDPLQVEVPGQEVAVELLAAPARRPAE